jgi:hypothetical protein
MKNLKLVGVAVLATMALTALIGASSANATALYNGATKLGVGSTFDWSTRFRAEIVSTAETQVLDECDSTVKGSITNAGGAGVEVQGNISELNWTNCTVPTSTDVKGGLKVADLGGTKGTVRSNAEIGVTMNTIFFGVCRYGVASGSHLGTITSSAAGTAGFNINAVTEKQAGSEFACPVTVRFVAELVSTTPDNARVEAS